MQLTLVTTDRQLRALFREVLEACSPCQWELCAAESAVRDGSGVYVWDFRPDSHFPADLDWAHGDKHLFLVRPEDLGTFGRNSRASDVRILLKPVQRAALAAFLEQIVPAGNNHDLRGDRDEILHQLLRTDFRLVHYSQARANFLARAAEDFRTPVTVISGYCSLLAAEPWPQINEDQQEVLDRMQQSAKRLSRAASAMFELSALGPAGNCLCLQEGDFKECVEQALDEVVPLAEEKRIDISLDFSHPAEMLRFDQSQMEQVLINLLENAIRFTPRFGSIEIRGYPCLWEQRRSSDSPEPNAFRLDIRDSGPPIAPQHQECIFEEHSPCSGSADRSGGGLGLAVCKWILHRHQGHIWAEPAAGGATFSFLLPLQAVAAARTAVVT